MTLKEGQPLTCNIAIKGFISMRSSLPASTTSVHFDKDVLRISFQAILLSPLVAILKPIVHH